MLPANGQFTTSESFFPQEATSAGQSTETQALRPQFVTFTAVQEAIFDRRFITDLHHALCPYQQDSVFTLKISQKEDKIGSQVSIDWLEGHKKEFTASPQIQLHSDELSQFPERMNCLLHYVAKRFSLIVIFLTPEVQRSVFRRCMELAQQHYIGFTTDSQTLYQTNLLASHLRFSLNIPETQIKPILLLNGNPSPHSRSHLNQKIGLTLSRIIRQNIDAPHCHPQDKPHLQERLRQQSSSLARAITGKRIGITFSAGCARGLSHIGVIQVLEENNIPIDSISACSMGSYVAALWAYGYNGQELAQMAEQLNSRWGLLKLVDPVLPPRRGVIAGGKIHDILEEAIGNAQFRDLTIPLHIIGTRLATLERTVFDKGPLLSAVLASCAIPGIVQPVPHLGDDYIDGGVVDPLPTRDLKERGIENIIASSVIPLPAHVRECSYFYENFPKPRRALAHFFNKHCNYFYRDNVFDILLRSFEASNIRVAQQDCKLADIVIRAVRCQDSWHEFSNPQKFIELGRKVATEQLAALKELNQGIL